MKETFRKGFSIFLTLAVFLSLIPLSSYATDEVWDGLFPKANENAAYSGGLGTKADPYLISTGADLAQLSINTNKIEYYSNDKYFL